MSYLITVVNPFNKNAIEKGLESNWPSNLNILTALPLNKGKNAEHVFEYELGSQIITNHKNEKKKLIYFLCDVLSIKVPSPNDRILQNRALLTAHNQLWETMAILPVDKQLKVNFNF